jgi:hypothetical protein
VKKRFSGSRLISGVLVMVLVLSVSMEVDAVITNGGFETGNSTGWTIDGLGEGVEVLQASNFLPSISPPEGSYFAVLSTGHGTRNSASGPDIDGNGFPDSDDATLSTTFTLQPGNVPAVLHFKWAFLTSEVGEWDDFFHVTLDGVVILSGSVPGAAEYVSPYPDVGVLDGVNYTVSSTGTINASTFANGTTGFQDFTYTITASGTYTLEFLVADQQNHAVDSGLLIDDVNLVVNTPVPTLSQWGMIILMSLLITSGIWMLRRKRNICRQQGS